MNRKLLVWLAIPALALLCGRGFGEDAKVTGVNSETAASSSNSVAATNSMDALDAKRKLTVGDHLSYRVVQERTDPRSLMIFDSGEVDVPLLGRVRAAGKTCLQLAQEIKLLLEKDYFFHATVIIGLDAVSGKSRGLIYIMGPVRNQGPMEIPLEGTFTLSKAILRAGGFADFANQKNVKLIRKNQSGVPETTVYDVDKILKGKEGKDPDLQPDDMILVPERIIAF